MLKYAVFLFERYRNWLLTRRQKCSIMPDVVIMTCNYETLRDIHDVRCYSITWIERGNKNRCKGRGIEYLRDVTVINKSHLANHLITLPRRPCVIYMWAGECRGKTKTSLTHSLTHSFFLSTSYTDWFGNELKFKLMYYHIQNKYRNVNISYDLNHARTRTRISAFTTRTHIGYKQIHTQ